MQQAVELQQAGDLLGAIARVRARAEDRARRILARDRILARRWCGSDGTTRPSRSIARRIDGEPDNPAFRFNLSLAFYKAARIQEAIPELERVLAIDRAHRPARLVLGDCYLKTGRFQDVVDLLAPFEAEFADDRAFAYVLGSAFSRPIGQPKGSG